MPPPETSPPTLREIAKAASVSVSTVSCALRGEPGVAPKTAERIRQTAERLGWRANPLVSAWLAHVRATTPRQKDLSLAYIISDSKSAAHYFSSPVYRAYHLGASERAQFLGFTLESFRVESTGIKRLNNVLASRSIPGVIIAPLERSGILDKFNWKGFSCAAIAHSLLEPRIHRAANHHFHSMVLAMSKLAEGGYRRIGLAIANGHDTRSGGMFSGGYWSVAQSLRGTPVSPFMPETSNFTFRNFRNWYEKSQPEAVVGFSVVKNWILKCGADIPGETAFVNLDWHDTYGPEAGINQKPELIGAAAVDLVTSQMYRNERGIPNDQKLIMIESEWMDGPTAPQRS